jgi:hypothetical protein
MQRTVNEMYAKIGTPDTQNQLKQEWRQHLSEVEQRLSAFRKSRFQPVSSPENSQVCYTNLYYVGCVCVCVCVIGDVKCTRILTL